MQYAIPGTDLCINEACDIFSADGKKCDLPITEDRKVFLTIYEHTRAWQLEWVLGISMFAIRNPEWFPFITFVPLVNKPRGVQIRPVTSRAFLCTTKDGRDFRHVLEFPGVAVSRDGIYISSSAPYTYLVPYEVRKHGYLALDLYDPVVKARRSIAVHRLVALAWVSCTDPGINNIVNHLDGVKHHNHYSNLEWTTYKGNIVHAFHNGLRTDQIQCRVYDITTKEEHKFDSIGETRAFLGLSDKPLLAVTELRANRVYCNRYEVRIGDDPRPWVYADPDVVNIEPSRYVFTTIDSDGTRRVFNGSRSFQRYYKLWNVSSARKLEKKFKEQYPDINLSVVDQMDHTPIQVKNVETGVVVEFPTVRDVARHYALSEASTLYTLKGNGRLAHKSLVMRRKPLTKTQWPTISPHKGAPWRIRVTDILTGEVREFVSLHEAARVLDMDRSQIKRCLSRVRPNDKYHMCKISEEQLS